MIKPLKNWKFKDPSPELVDVIAQRTKLSRPAASVLVSRGISSIEEAEGFLYPDLCSLHNPFLLTDMYPAVERIRRAVDRKEKILVYGDRDVDGISSISVMVRTLASLGADVSWYIPCDEGYGLHTGVIERYAAQGVKLIVTVDCGISAAPETEFARGLGIDVVVTDHHEAPASGIPKAVAVVDPKRPDSGYPFSDLAGCSVSFKVAEALMHSFGKYFNEEMVVCALDPGIGALKIRNGVVLEKFSSEAPPEKAGPELLAFCGERRLVVFNAPSFLARTGAPGRDVIDIAALGRTYYPPVTTFDDLAREMKLPPVSGEGSPGKAYRLLDAFLRLEERGDLRMSFFRQSHMDVVALGTIADIMPLVRENRTLVKHGLERLSKSAKAGVQALLERCAGKNRRNCLSAKTVSWNVTPVLNAAGRRGKAGLSAELLLTEDAWQAEKILNEIMKLNSERKELQAENLEKFMPLLEQQCDLENDKMFIVTASGIEHGVTGIIASQIMRKYRRPTLLLIIENGEAMGAARSVEGFDIVAALGRVSDILIKYGGHSQAAGLTIAAGKLPEFRERMKAIASDEISAELLVPTIHIDAELKAEDISLDLVRELSEMEPFGMGNPNPVFAVKGMKVREHVRMGAGNDHLKLRVSKNGGQAFNAVGWGMGGLDDDIDACGALDLAVQLEINTWQDKASVQLLIQDMRPSEA